MDQRLAVVSDRTYDKDGFLIPRIPCTLCGRFVLYTDAVARNVDGVQGYAHPSGSCDATDRAEWTTRNARHQPMRNVS